MPGIYHIWNQNLSAAVSVGGKNLSPIPTPHPFLPTVQKAEQWFQWFHQILHDNKCRAEVTCMSKFEAYSDLIG